MKKEIKSSFLLFMAAFIWGVAFVGQSVGMDYVGPMTFNGCRFFLGGTVLLPLIYFREKRNKEHQPQGFPEANNRQKGGRKGMELTGGLCCGLALCIASALQQYGIEHTSVGKAGFITALYIVIVPLLGIFLKKKAGIMVWCGALLACIGFYLLCITEDFFLNKGDLLVLLCAVGFSVHILIIDHFSPKTDPVKLSCIQTYVAGSLCTVAAFVLEKPSWESVFAGAIPILYAGILSCGAGYTLQIIGQAQMNPTVASMILSLESVVSVLAGWILLEERLSGRQLWGCALVFAAVILTQLSDFSFGMKKK